MDFGLKKKTKIKIPALHATHLPPDSPHIDYLVQRMLHKISHGYKCVGSFIGGCLYLSTQIHHPNPSLSDGLGAVSLNFVQSPFPQRTCSCILFWVWGDCFPSTLRYVEIVSLTNSFMSNKSFRQISLSGFALLSDYTIYSVEGFKVSLPHVRMQRSSNSSQGISKLHSSIQVPPPLFFHSERQQWLAYRPLLRTLRVDEH